MRSPGNGDARIRDENSGNGDTRNEDTGTRNRKPAAVMEALRAEWGHQERWDREQGHWDQERACQEWEW